MGERYRAVCHKRHGWIETPDGSFFAPSRSGKTVELHEPTPQRCPGCHVAFAGGEVEHLIDCPYQGRRAVMRYPFGTTFHASSLIAYEEVDPDAA